MEANNNIGQLIKTYAIPYYRHTYHTKLSAQEVRDQLLQHIDTEKESFVTKIFGRGTSKKEGYVGKFEGNTFRIHRIKRGKNSNRPVILGNITSSVNTTKVDVVMRLSYFSLVWTVLSLAFLIYIVLEDDNTIAFNENINYFLLFILCFGYLATTISFNYEASKSKRFLKKILQPVSPHSGSDWIIRN